MPSYGKQMVSSAKEAAPNTTVEFPLDRLPNGLVRLFVRFFAGWTVTGGSGAGTIPADALHRYLRKLVVKYEGEDRMTAPAQFWRWLVRFLMPSSPENTQPSSLAANANQAVEITVPVLFNMAHATPEEQDRFNLPVQHTDNPVLSIELGSPSDCAIGEDGTVGFTNPKIEVLAETIAGAAEHPFQDLIEVHQFTIDANQSDNALSVVLTGLKAGLEVRAIFIAAESGGVGGAGHQVSDTLIRSLIFKNGGVTLYDKTAWDSLRNLNKMAYALTARESGVVILDAAEDRDTRPGQLWDIGAVKPELVFDVNPGAGQNRIRIWALGVRRGRIELFQQAAA